MCISESNAQILENSHGYQWLHFTARVPVSSLLPLTVMQLKNNCCYADLEFHSLLKTIALKEHSTVSLPTSVRPREDQSASPIVFL